MLLEHHSLSRFSQSLIQSHCKKNPKNSQTINEKCKINQRNESMILHESEKEREKKVRSMVKKRMCYV